ncbi:hypothetical protein [Hymenobacter antarcticus]|uniref:Uncharacterized protein n=1 Tax=Hymenobacter antarcticus TaxID=486270 RepID=A0ABP7R5M0_9BACT
MAAANSPKLSLGRLASTAMRYNDVARCENMAAYYDKFLRRTSVQEPNYYSFIEYPFWGNLGKRRERLVVYNPQYKEEVVEFYEVKEADYLAAIESLNGTVVEDLVQDPDYHNGRESAQRTVVRKSGGQRIGVIINPPLPFVEHSRRSDSAKYLVPLAALAVGLAVGPVLKALRQRSKTSSRR